MGERVRRLSDGVDPKDPAAFIDRVEELCESMYEDREAGAACSYSVSLKAKGKKGSIPRGIGELVNDSSSTIPLLIAEIRRRETDPFSTMTVDRFMEDFVRWADKLDTKDWEKVTAFVEEKANNGAKPSSGIADSVSRIAAVLDSEPDPVKDWGVEDEVGQARKALRQG